MKREQLLKQQAVEESEATLAPARGYDSHSKETDRLVNEAIKSVNTLSKHLEVYEKDKHKMYKANRAIHMLWEIQ